MKGSLVPCGHTFSDFQIYDEKTAKEECIKMVRNIMEYWKAEAARIEPVSYTHLTLPTT